MSDSPQQMFPTWVFFLNIYTATGLYSLVFTLYDSWWIESLSLHHIDMVWEQLAFYLTAVEIEIGRGGAMGGIKPVTFKLGVGL